MSHESTAAVAAATALLMAGLSCQPAATYQHPDAAEWSPPDGAATTEGCATGLVWSVSMARYHVGGSTEVVTTATTSGAQGGASRLGIVGSALSGGWLGEACADGSNACHRVTGDLDLLWVEDTADVVLSETTNIGWDEFAGATFILVAPDGHCEVAGAHPSFYDDLGCCLAW